MSLLRTINTTLNKQRNVVGPNRLAGSIIGAIRSNVGYDGGMRSFRFPGDGSMEAIKKKRGKKSKVSDDKNVAEGVANAIMNGDIILSEARRFDVNKPIQKSIINIYDAKRVNINQQGSVDKTTESERREQELEAARRMGNRRRSEAQQAKNALLGIGAGSMLTPGGDDGGGDEGDSLLEDAVESTVGGAVGGAAVSQSKKFMSMLGDKFRRMRRRFRVFSGRAGQRFAQSGVARFLSNPRQGFQNFAQGLRNFRTTVTESSAAARTVQAGRNLRATGGFLANLSKTGVKGLATVGRSLLLDPAMLPLATALEGIDIGTAMKDETIENYDYYKQARARTISSQLQNLAEVRADYANKPASVYHTDMAGSLRHLKDVMIDRLREIRERQKFIQNEINSRGRGPLGTEEEQAEQAKLKEDESTIRLLMRGGVSSKLPHASLYDPTSGGKLIHGSINEIIKTHEILAKDETQKDKIISLDPRMMERARFFDRMNRGVGTSTFQDTTGYFGDMGMADIPFLRYFQGSPSPSVAPAGGGSTNTAPQIIPVTVPVGGGGSPQPTQDDPPTTRTEEQGTIRDRSMGYQPSGPIRPTRFD